MMIGRALPVDGRDAGHPPVSAVCVGWPSHRGPLHQGKLDLKRDAAIARPAPVGAR